MFTGKSNTSLATQSGSLREWLSTIAEVCAITCPFLIAMLVLWLDSRYVTREELRERDRAADARAASVGARVSALERALLILIEQQKENALQNKQLDGHEQRIRFLEIETAKK